MMQYDESTYGDRIANTYDELYSEYEPASIELLYELTGNGPVLELGIGTGRIALPLQKKGVIVQGIDASPAMIQKLRSKPQGDKIEVQTGSFAQFSLDERFQLVYVVFNTFFGLLTQTEQVQCFRSVSEHLLPDGLFLIEAFVPDLSRFIDHQTVRAVNQSEDVVQLDISQVDPVAQQVTSQHILLSNAGPQMYPVKLRYAWPSELDLMAQLAGLSLKHRWGSWFKEEFTKYSTKHISVYGYVG